MNVLIIGSGGREHAFAWKIAQSKKLENLYIAPGNAGTAEYGRNLPISYNDFEEVKKACIEYKIDILFPGPEDPLVAGIGDFFKNKFPAEMVITNIKDHWVSGIYKDHVFDAKVYSEPSEYGINNGCVSKLSVLKQGLSRIRMGWGRERTAYTIDRGHYDGPKQDRAIGEEIAKVIDEALGL